MNAIPPTNANALVAIWAKGYRVSIPSEEFQLIVPPASEKLQGLEQLVAAAPWPLILDELLRGDELLLKDEFAVLVDRQQLLAIAVAPSRDRFRRRSIVAVGALAACDWSDSQLAIHVARTRKLAARLAQQYGDVLGASLPHVEKQLRNEGFLPNRSFGVAGEEPADQALWTQIISEIRKWRGVTGIATSRLCQCGPNVLYGTNDELERVRSKVHVDGLFESRSREIQPLGDGLTPWIAPKPDDQKAGGKVVLPEDQLASIRSEIKEIRHDVGLLRGLLSQVLDFLEPVHDFVVRKGRKRKD